MSSSSSSGYGGDAGVSSDSGYGSTYTSSSSGYGGDAGVSSDAGYGSTYTSSSTDSTSTVSSTESSTDSGGYGSTVSTDSGYGATSVGSTGFEGSPETAAAHSLSTTDASTVSTTDSGYGATSVGSTGFEGSPETAAAHSLSTTDASTYSGSTESTDTSDASGYGTVSESAGYGTGMEGPESGPQHAQAVNTDAATWSAPAESDTSSFATGMEGPESGPQHAQAVNTDAATWSAPAEAQTYATGMEGPEVGAEHAQVVNANPAAWTGQVTLESLGLPMRTGMEDSPEGQGLAFDMQTQEALGRLNAEQTRQVLSAIGINPDGFQPSQLRGLTPGDPQYQQLYTTIRDMGYPMANPPRGDDRLAGPYSARAFQTLTDEGTLATMGAINRYAIDSRYGEPLGDVRAQLLTPMVKGFGLATLSDIAPTEVFDGLRAIDSRWQQHLVGQLISGDYTYDAYAGEAVPVEGIGMQYDQDQLARFADAIIDYSQRYPSGVLKGKEANRTESMALNMFGPHADPAYMMYAGPDAWDGDLAMNVPEALAWRALAANDPAAYQFLGMERDNLTATMRVLNDFDGQFGYTAEENQQLAGLIQDYTTETLRAGLIDAVKADPSLLPGALDRFADMTDEMAQRNVLTPYQQAYLDVLATALVSPEGRVTMPYFDDIGREAVRQRATPYASDEERAAQDFNRVDLTNAFAELGLARETAQRLADVYTVWGNMQMARIVDDGLVNAPQKERDAAIQAQARPAALVADVIRQGFENNGLPTVNAQWWADNVALTGQLVGAFAGPVSNGLAASGKGLAAILAGTLGSASWGGSTAHTAYRTSMPTPAISGSEFGATVTAAMRQNMANAVAAQQGQPAPVGAAMFQTLDDAFGGDPFTTLDTMMNTEQLRNTEARQRTQGEQHWSR